jgi:tetratricopeptide (TPR) repeat protein
MRIKWPLRRNYTLGLAGGLLVLALIPVAIAQSTRRPAPPLQAAAKALIEGRLDEVASLTATLNAQDPAVVALRARALIGTGRYQEAEALLRPAAERAPGSDAALELGLLLQMLTREEATRILERVATGASRSREAAELARGGRALHALNRRQDANALFRDAAAAAPDDPAINTAWGDLFLDTPCTECKAEALKSFQLALEADAQYAPAILGAARAIADENPPQAAAMAKKAIEINTSDVAARLFLAAQAFDADRPEETRELVDAALAVNPSSLDARSLLAALAYVEDRRADFDAEVARVLAIAPRFGEVYRMAGQLTARKYRFDEAVTLVRKGLELDPNDSNALLDLGTHLLRTGDEPGARTVLEQSFKIDPFNVVTYNLLEMMDTLDTFVTFTEGDIVMRMDKEEAPVLKEPAMAMARDALASLSERYRFKPQGPILIEIFPQHDDFAVRNVGLPGMIGALGACFGRVVTMDSPRARPPGEFQWEATLWHELSHVITLQMSNQRAPRWLSEGTSVYEETLERNEWGRGMELQFAQLLEREETLPLKDLEGAFQNPQTISLAYYQASLLVEHLVGAFGDAGLHRLLRAYGEGQSTDEALKSALGTDFEGLQEGFDATVDKRFGALRRALAGPDLEKFAGMPVEVLRGSAAEHGNSFPFLMLYGQALRTAGMLDEAVGVFEKAAALVPVARGAESPQAQIAEIALERKDPAAAIRALEGVVQNDIDNVEAARTLARLMRENKVTDAARLSRVYQRIVAIDPFDAEAQAQTGRLAMAANDHERAIRAFSAVVALKPVDQAAAHTDLAESYFKAGRRAEARKQTLAALEIAPSYTRAQDLLLDIAGATP